MATASDSIGLTIEPKLKGLAKFDAFIKSLEKLEAWENRELNINVVGNLKGMREMASQVEKAAAGMSKGVTEQMSRMDAEAKAQVARIRKRFESALPGVAMKIKWDFTQPMQALAALEEKAKELARLSIREDNYGNRGDAQTYAELAAATMKEVAQLKAELAKLQAEAATSGHSAVNEAVHSAVDTKVISNAEIMTEYRKHGFGNLEAVGGPKNLPVERLTAIMEAKLRELNAAITGGAQMFVDGSAKLTTSTAKMRIDKDGKLVPVKQTSTSITGAGERMTITNSTKPGQAGIDIKVNEGVKAMADAMGKLNPELQKAAKTLYDSLSVKEAMSRGVTSNNLSDLQRAGALPTGRINTGFREAAKFSLANVEAFPRSAAGSVPAGASKAAGNFAKAEQNLQQQSLASGAALFQQDEILKEKLKRLKDGTTETQNMAQAEGELARGSEKSAQAVTAARKGEEKLISQRYKNGKLVQKTFVDAGGVVRKVDVSRPKQVTTEDFSRLKEASQKVAAVRDEFTQLIQTQKAQGVSAQALNATYQTFGKELDKIASQYKGLEDAGVTSIGRLAEAQRQQGKRVVITDDRKKAKELEADQAKAQDDLNRQLVAQEKEKQDQESRRKSDAAALQKQRAAALLQQEKERLASLEAQRILGGFNSNGFTETSRTTKTSSKGRTTETINLSKENEVTEESARVVIERDRAGKILNATTTETSKVMKNAGMAAKSSAKDFLANTLQVTAWALSVGALYGALNLLKGGASATADIEAKTAVLTQVFQGTKEEALQLRDATLSMGVAYNRSGSEALDASIRFSRMGLTASQVLEAVAVSLQAANIAEIDTATAAEQISSIMAAYGLNIGEVRTVLGQLNTVSNTYNATVKEMLAGISRVAPLAKTAGLSLVELTSLIGAGVGRTGRPGSEFGNAIKSIIVGMSDPKQQKKLKEGFSFDVKDQTGEMKDFSTVLRDLFVRYEELTGAEKQNLAQMVGKKMQASRLTALLDGYVQAQVLAIGANRNLTSAEKENAAVRDTVIGQLHGLQTAYESVFSTVAKSNTGSGLTSFVGEMLGVLKNLIVILNKIESAGIPLTAMFVTLTAVTLTYMAVTGKAGTASGFLVNSLVATKTALKEVSMAFVEVTAGAGRATIATVGLTGAVEGLGIAATVVEVLTGMVVIILALAAAALVVGAAMDAFNEFMQRFADETEKANAKLAGFNKQLEELKAKASAEKDLARLADTISRVLAGGNVPTEQAQQWLKLLESAAGLRRGELTDLYRAGDLMKLNGKLAEVEAKANQDSARANERSLDVKEKALRSVDQAIKGREGQLDKSSPGTDYYSDDTYKSLLSERAKLLGEVKEMTAQTTEEGEEGTQPLDDQNKLLEKRMALIDRLYQSMSSYNEEGKVRNEIAAQEAKLALLKEEGDARKANADAQIQSIEEQIKANDASFKDAEKFKSLQSDKRVLTENLASQVDDYRVAGEKIAKGNGVGSWIGNHMPDGFQKQQSAASSAMQFDTAPQPDVSPLKAFWDKNSAIMEEGAAWAQRNNDLQGQLINLKKITGDVEDANVAKERTAAEVKRDELEQELDYARKLDALAAGKKNAEYVSQGYRVGDNKTEQDLAELRRISTEKAAVNPSTGLGNTAEALAELKRLQENLKGTKPFAGDQLQALRLQGQLQETGVRMEDMRLGLVSRVYSVEADILNEKIKQNQEASRSLLMASREEQLRAALAAKFSKERGGRGFSADEFQFLDQNTKQGIQQNNPGLLPDELKGHLTELQAEQAKLQQAFKAGADGVDSFNEQIRKKAEELRNIQVDPNIVKPANTGADVKVEEMGTLIATAVNAMGIQVSDALGQAGDRMVAAVGDWAGKFEGRLAKIERGGVNGAISRAQGALNS